MTRDEILVRLRTHLASALELDEADIVESATLVEDLDADSLDLLELILVVKDDFGIVVTDGEVKALLTELAQFLPDERWRAADFTDEELAEVARSLTVGTIVEFIDARAEVAP